MARLFASLVSGARPSFRISGRTLPTLQGRDALVRAIAETEWAATPSGDIAKFAKNLGVEYPILIGKEDVGESYGFSGSRVMTPQRH